jgi:hypothetical protein
MNDPHQFTRNTFTSPKDSNDVSGASLQKTLTMDTQYRNHLNVISAEMNSSNADGMVSPSSAAYGGNPLL